MNISIVIPTFNSHQYIDETLGSLLGSASLIKEILVIDNLSTDGTLEYLHNLDLEQVLICSQSDKGPAQALNLGFVRAKGDLIGWINSDDFYAGGAIERAVAAFENDPNLKMVYGLGAHINASGAHLELYPTYPPTAEMQQFANGSFICQPTVFFRKEVIYEVGLLNEDLKTAFDMDYWMRIFLHYPREQIGFIDQIQAYSRLHDQCITRKYRQTVAIESMQLIAKYLGHAPSHWVLTYFNELCASYPFIEATESLLQLINQVFDRVEALMLPSEYEELSQNLNADYRIQLSSEEIYVNTQPDGWVSNTLLVRLRSGAAPKSTIKLECCGDWPIEGDLDIQIRSSGGLIENYTVNAQETFNINLEVPQFQVSSFMSWQIFTPNIFVPSVVNQGQSDSRELSFKVLNSERIYSES